MCPKKCVTSHSGSVADRTDFLANSKKATCKKRLKVEGRSSPIQSGTHRVQRTDLSYFCGEVRNRYLMEEKRIKLIISGSKKPAIYKHKATVDVMQAKKEIEIAREEWDQIGTTSYVSTSVLVQTSLISSDEVLNYFRQKDMKQYLKCIKPVKQRKGFEALKHWFAGPPKLHSNLIVERDLFFAIALCPFDTSDEIHMRVLQTLYKTLTGTDRDCPRYGKHWEDLGFQGVDPGTDLRGVGFLGLVHLLSLILNPTTADLAKEISQLAKHERQ
ncbi:ELMO domain-containing protein 3, partial [Araneus ventricosus]